MAIATLGVIALDCPEPRALAEFYAAVLDGRIEGEGEWVEVKGHTGTTLAFQRVERYVPPRWPSAEHPQQAHLDFLVERARLDAAEREVLALGARLLEGDFDGQRTWRVYADPVGHPFCLCVR